MLTKKQLSSEYDYFRLLVSPRIYSNTLGSKQNEREHKDQLLGLDYKCAHPLPVYTSSGQYLKSADQMSEQAVIIGFQFH